MNYLMDFLITKHLYIIGLNLPIGPLNIAAETIARSQAKHFWFKYENK